jgi:RHS repeat-associated protein
MTRIGGLPLSTRAALIAARRHFFVAGLLVTIAVCASVAATAFGAPHQQPTRTPDTSRSLFFGPNPFRPFISARSTTAPDVPLNPKPPDGTYQTTTTPRLSAIINDPDRGYSHVDFEVYRSSDNVLVASGRSPDGVSGQQANWTVPTGALAHGVLYSWHARGDDGTLVSPWTSNLRYTPDTPPTAGQSSPGDSATVETREPVLEATGHDADVGDGISFQFQLARDSGFTNLVGASGWLPETKNFSVPESWFLKDQTKYYWRVQAQDEFGALSGWTSGVSFTVGLNSFGVRDYYPMWTHGPIAVNEATGNLVLSLPTPSYPSAVQPLHIDITFNQLNKKGGTWLGTGFSLGASPTKIVDLQYVSPPDQQDAVRVYFDDGTSAQYNRIGDTNNFQAEAPDGSVLTESDSGSYTLTFPSGDVFSFSPPDTTTGEAYVSSADYSYASSGKGKLRYSYTLGKLTSITDEGNRKLSLRWYSLDPNSCPSATLCVQGPDGTTWKYLTVSSGGVHVSRVNDGTRDILVLTWDSSGRLVKVQNANDLNPSAASPGYNGSHAITIGYDSTNRVTSVTDGPISGQTPSSSTWTFTYASGGSTAPTTNAHGSLAAGTVRTTTGFTTMTPPRQQGAGNPKQDIVYYDDLNHPIEHIDLLGNVTQAGYNGRDQLLWTEDADDNPTDYSYDSYTNVLKDVTGPDPDGSGPLGRPVTSFRYDEAQIGTASTPGPVPTGLQARYYSSFEIKGQPTTTQTDGNVDVNWGTGAPAALPGHGGDSYSVRWSGVLSVPSDGYYTFSIVADDHNRLTVDDYQLVNDPTNHTTYTVRSKPVHLNAGLHDLTLEHQENDGTAEAHLRWSCAQCTPAIADQVIPSSAFQPAWMNRTSTVSPLGRINFSHFAEPGLGQPDYKLVKLVDGTSLITSYSYDGYGRVTQKVMPKGNAGRTIDAQGNLQGSPDSTFATSYTYYAPTDTAAPPAVCGGGTAIAQSQQLASKSTHGLATIAYVYDKSGNLIAGTKAAGTTCRTLDNEGRVTSTIAPGDAQPTTYTYDPAGAVRTATNTGGTLTTQYDEAGRATRTIDSFGAEATTAYDVEGNPVTRRAAAGPLASSTVYTTTYAYDDLGQLSGMTDPAGRSYAFTYDRRGGLKTTQYPNGTFSWQDLNPAGWLTALYNRHGTLPSPLPASVPADSQGSPIADSLYQYNLDGLETQDTRTGGSLSTQVTTYAYDNLGRLTDVTLPTGVVRHYGYDLDSNRTSISENGSTVSTYTYDPTQSAGVDQLTTTRIGATTTSYGYNGDGAVTQRGADSLSWDGWGRLSGGTFAGKSVTYTFDPSGFRRQRSSGSTTTRYLLGGTFESNPSGAITNADIDGPQADLAHYSGAPSTATPVSFLYYNGHGDVAAEANASGGRTAAYTYDPFGMPIDQVPANATTERWLGRWDKKLDTNSGLVEMGARPYDPSLGRFLAVDPVEGGALNNYDYASQNPVTHYDLDGTDDWGQDSLDTARTWFWGWVTHYAGYPAVWGDSFKRAVSTSCDRYGQNSPTCRWWQRCWRSPRWCVKAWLLKHPSGGDIEAIDKCVSGLVWGRVNIPNGLGNRLVDAGVSWAEVKAVMKWGMRAAVKLNVWVDVINGGFGCAHKFGGP